MLQFSATLYTATARLTPRSSWRFTALIASNSSTAGTSEQAAASAKVKTQLFYVVRVLERLIQFFSDRKAYQWFMFRKTMLLNSQKYRIISQRKKRNRSLKKQESRQSFIRRERDGSVKMTRYFPNDFKPLNL